MSFPRYPTYEDSGIEWLGEVPAHWRLRRLKHASSVFPSNVDKKSVEGETPVRLCNYTDVYYNEKITPTIEFMSATASLEQINKFTLMAGDVIITKDSETPDDIAIAAYVSDTLPGVVCGYHLAMIRPREGVSGAFIKRLFDAAYAKAQFATLANGLTRYGLGQYELDNIVFAFPPQGEQALIAAFLDRETTKIDALVAEQRRLIDLLKEKRQAVISHAVTKGLNPHAPMKPSGIEWLGEVPVGWDVLKLKFLCKVQTGDKDTENAVEGGQYPFFVRSQTVERINSMAFDCEAVLTAGDGVGVGKVFHYHKGPFDFHQRVYMMSDFEKVSGRFFFHYLRENFFKVALEGGAKSTVDSLRRPMFMNFPFCVPPPSEQSAIVRHIECESSKFDALTVEAQSAIDLLQERRTALISAAVTGQIDVRGLVETEAA